MFFFVFRSQVEGMPFSLSFTMFRPGCPPHMGHSPGFTGKTLPTSARSSAAIPAPIPARAIDAAATLRMFILGPLASVGPRLVGRDFQVVEVDVRPGGP